MKNTKSVSYRILLTEKQYLKMVVANVVNRFGDSIDAVAFGWLVYQLTGSATWLTVIYGVNFIPTILFQPLTGALVSYWDKKKTVVLCDFGRGTLVMLIGVMFITENLTPWLLMVITFLNSCLEAMRMPCSMGIVPKILKKENYTIGSSLNQGVCRISELIGMGISGVVIAVFGVGGALIVDAVTFVLSGIILIFLKFKDEKSDIRTSSYFDELKCGFGYFAKNKVFVVIILTCFLINITGVPWDSLKSAYISESLRLGATALSINGVLTTIGMIFGTFIFPFVSNSLSPKTLFVGGGISLGLLYFVLILAGIMPTDTLKLIVYGVSGLLFGIVSAGIQMGLTVNLMSKVEDGYMSRVGGIFNAVACSAIPIGSFLTAMATSFWGVNQIFIASGIITVLLFVAARFFKSVKALDKK